MTEKEAIRAFLATCTPTETAIGDNDSLLANRVLDSLKIAELILFIESQYQVELDSDDLTPANLDTINAIVALLERKGAV